MTARATQRSRRWQHAARSGPTRPPTSDHSWHPPSGNLLYSNGASWVTITEDTGWSAISFKTGWAEAGPITTQQVRRRNGVVYFSGAFLRTGAVLAANTQTAMAQLPVGCRPAKTLIVMAWVTLAGNDIPAFCEIATDGTVTIFYYESAIATGNGVYLTLASWPAA
jgi:hypothetical protein